MSTKHQRLRAGVPRVIIVLIGGRSWPRRQGRRPVGRPPDDETARPRSVKRATQAAFESDQGKKIMADLPTFADMDNLVMCVTEEQVIIS